MATKKHKGPHKPFGAVLLLAALFPLAACAGTHAENTQGEPFVLLHGLNLKPVTMKKMASGLKEAGYRACRIDYPSHE
jgi:hypothetical protein